MIDALKNLMGLGAAPDYKQLMKDGAVIIDVRTKSEFAGGHIEGSVNIPVDQLPNSGHRLPKKEKTIITCCASGMRSAAAKTMLQSYGYSSVYNGGSWSSLQRKI